MFGSFVVLVAAASPTALPATTPPVASAECPRVGSKPPGCIDPPLREQVDIYPVWRVLDGSHPADTVMIRRPSMAGQTGAAVAQPAFPAKLRGGTEGGVAQVTVRLTIASDGTATSCTPVAAKAWLIGSPGTARIDLPDDPALGASSCALVRAGRTFRPAIDAAGTRIEAPIDVTVHYVRQRHEPGIAPAPPSPSRFLGTSPYGAATGWPPRYTLTERIDFTAPKFKNFLPDRRNLPEQAVVGVVMDFAQDGRALGCAVKRPGGDARLDAATCAALMTVRNIPSRWQVRDLPVEVSWSRDKGKIALGTRAVLPGLAQPLTIDSADRPAGEPPKRSVRIRVLLDPAAKPISCTIDGPSYDDAFDAASCRIALAQGRFTGGQDGFGRPAASGMDLQADWSRGQILLAGY